MFLQNIRNQLRRRTVPRKGRSAITGSHQRRAKCATWICRRGASARRRTNTVTTNPLLASSSSWTRYGNAVRNAGSPKRGLKTLTNDFCRQIFGWKPEYYNDTKNLPSTMPADLQEHIKAEEHANRLDTVWVSCSGENPADVENMGAIQYIPRRGFPGYYFPFTNTPGYLSPLVAVFFEKPQCKFYTYAYVCNENWNSDTEGTDTIIDF